MNRSPHPQTLTRRRFLQASTAGATLAAGGLLHANAAEPAGDGSFSFGLVTDIHYADVPAKGTRHYRDSQEKLRLAVETFNRKKLPLVAELGDFVDAGPGKEEDIEYLHAIREVFGEFRGRRHYVLGNHCLARLSKAEFLAHCGTEVRKSYHSFDQDRYHFVVLDANFKRDGSTYEAGNFSWTDTWIHPPQQKWLADDLQKAGDRKTIVFVHQNLDKERDACGVKNGQQVRSILEKSGNVLAVFQGHLHSGGYRQIGGIGYYTLRAMVEQPTAKNNAYAVITLDRSDRITVEGFGRQGDVTPEEPAAAASEADL